MRKSPNDLLTIGQAAKAVGLHRQTVRDAIKRESLGCEIVAVTERQIRIRRRDIEAYARRTKGAPGRPVGS